MSDPPRKPPYLRPIRPDEPAPITERVAVPPPYTAARPFTRATDIVGELTELKKTVANMGRAVDGLGVTVNHRFDVFHEELALLRATVVGDHAPRIDKVETTLGQKAARGGGVIALALVALPMLADAMPKYAHYIQAILGALQ